MDADGSRVLQLTVGAGHTCALMVEGRVRCWGDGSVGQLGIGLKGALRDPSAFNEDVDLDGQGGRAVEVVAGFGHTCALLEGGRVRCWGADASG